MLIAVSAQAPAHAKPLNGDTATVITGTGRHPFKVEIADDEPSRARGLMFRRHLDADAGMLFVFDEIQPVSFWMHNTYIPLDMVFIDAEGIVKHIAENAQPFSDDHIDSEGPVLAVLELNAGTAEKIGLKPGDKVVHPAFGE